MSRQHATGPSVDRPRDGMQALRALAGSWKSLVVYEMLMSLVSATVLTPLVLAGSYQLIGISGKAVLGNWDLIRFLVSPLGLVALLLTVSLTLSMLLIEYAGLILLADAALRGIALPTHQIVARLFGAAPRLFGLGILQAAFVMLMLLPFLGIAGATYWLLLAGSDINFYLAERPPRFWLAIAIGVVLAIGLAISAAWMFVHWALSVPLCVLNGQSWLGTLRLSSRLARGRTWRLLLIIAGWLVFKEVVLLIALKVLDGINEILFATFSQRLSTILWSTVTLLVIDTVALQFLGAVFAIGLAALIAYEYEQARRLQPAPQLDTMWDQVDSAATWPAWRTRVAIIILAIAGPVASVGYAIVLTREYAEHHTAKVTAHRAGPKAAPENSLLALQMSLEARADFVEIDVQQTADGHVVLLHDRDLRRVTGEARDLHEMKLAELQNLRLTLEGQPTAARVPTLAEFIVACDGRIQLNVEMKDFGHSTQLAAAVLDVLREHDFTQRAVVSCFELAPLAEIRRSEPRLPIGAILSVAQGDITQLPVDFLSLNHRFVSGDVVRRAHRRGMQVHAWTVNERETALRLLDLGCDNLITSDPALMREVADWYADLGEVQRMLLRLRRWLRE